MASCTRSDPNRRRGIAADFFPDKMEAVDNKKQKTASTNYSCASSLCCGWRFLRSCGFIEFSILLCKCLIMYRKKKVIWLFGV